MSEIAAFLVVIEKNAHPEQAELAMAAVRQIKGVVGIRTMYNDTGDEIARVREWREDVRLDAVDRFRQAGAS